MPRKIKFKQLTERQFDNAVIKLAYNYLTIKQCKKCGFPRVDGYCCNHCGDSNPDESYEEEKA